MTRRTAFTGSAAGRRRERRAHLQSEASVNADVMHRPTPSKVELQCKRKPAMQADRLVANPYTQQIEAAAERATLSLGKRKSFGGEPKNYGRISCMGRQKVKGKSMPPRGAI